jgi:hypothetical protein
VKNFAPAATSATLEGVSGADDRREYPRLEAPVFCRPAGRPIFRRRKAVDVSLGGLRLYADDAPARGDRLQLELFLPDESELLCIVEVVWIDELPEGSPARFDVGAKFVALDDADRERLAQVLKPLDSI